MQLHGIQHVFTVCNLAHKDHSSSYTNGGQKVTAKFAQLLSFIEHYCALISDVIQYRYYVSGHYPSSCFYLETSTCLYSKIQCFGDRILPLSSGLPEARTNSINRAQLSRFYLKMEAESSLRNVVF
jgi:hypothetical protein